MPYILKLLVKIGFVLFPVLGFGAIQDTISDTGGIPSACHTIRNTSSSPKHTRAIQDTNIWCGNQTITVEALGSLKAPAKNPEVESKHQPFDWNALIRDIAWPVTLLLVVFVLRQRLPVLIERVIDRIKRFKHKDTELEFLSKEANESLTRAAHGSQGATINVAAIFETVKLNEWATLIMARMLMRKGLLEIIGANQSFGESPSLQKLIKHCELNKLISEELLVDLERLREVTYFAEWWTGRVPSRGEWKWALERCKSIIDQLFDLQPVA